jgi:Protein of unknown function (DUF4236)
MGFRFRRSVRILPGIRLNFSKHGVSTSIGVRGAHMTFGKTGTRTTIGIPGSGLSYTHLEKPHQKPHDVPPEGSGDSQPAPLLQALPPRSWWEWLVLALAIGLTASAVYLARHP